MLSWFAQRLTRREDRPRVYLEREGSEHLEQLGEAARKVPWAISMLQMVWIAGPVTFLGMQGGYLLGYGHPVPRETFIFYATFTIVAGLIGLGTRLLYEATRGRRKRERQRKLSLVVDRLADLIAVMWDLSLADLDPESRRREAAVLLLRRVEVGSNAVRLAVEDLTDDPVLAECAARVEVFRRSGQRHRVDDLLEGCRERVDAALEQLHGSYPEAARVLRDRLHGDIPDMENGEPRDDHFIERVFSAIEEDNLNLMTLNDVEEMFVLAFELINGREIVHLGFEYRGRWEFARATDAMEAARGRYRIAQARGFSRLKALVEFLARHDDYGVIDTIAGLKTPELLDKAQEAIRQLNLEIERLAREARKGDGDAERRLRSTTAVLARSLRLYRSMRRAFDEVGSRHAEFIRAMRRWDEMAAEVFKEGARLRTGPGRGGLRIFERPIRLESDEKLAFAARLADHLEAIKLTSVKDRVVLGGDEFNAPLGVDDAKELAVEIALMLEPYIHLSRPSIQRTINASHAPYLGTLEPGLSAQTKAGLAAAMIDELNTDLGPAAERLAQTLAKTYHVQLDEQAVDFLVDHFGASRDRLETLAGQPLSQPANVVSSLASRPAISEAFDRGWKQVIERSIFLLERYHHRRGLTRRR